MQLPGREAVTTQFPFSAIVGQDEMVEALLINAVDPTVGGVLVRGERFTEFTEPPFDREALISATEGLLRNGATGNRGLTSPEGQEPA